MFLGILGLFSVALPHARRYAEAELQRGLTLIIQDRVFGAINSFPGLSRFESPAFSDKIRLVQQIGNGAADRFASGLMTCGQSLMPGTGSRLVIKRVAALPGDAVPDPVRPVAGEAGVVPPGMLVVLGDNPRGMDLRHWASSRLLR